MVKGNFEPAQERRLIWDYVPKDVKDKVTRMSSMEEIWEFLDDEFGKDSELMSDRVAYLHDFKYSKGAVTEASKFKELNKCWTMVYSDLDNVGKLGILDHPPTIKGFITKLPSKAIGDRYNAMAKELRE